MFACAQHVCTCLCVPLLLCIYVWWSENNPRHRSLPSASLEQDPFLSVAVHTGVGGPLVSVYSPLLVLLARRSAGIAHALLCPPLFGF